MNNPMSFNFFTASDKPELPLEQTSTFSLSSLLSQHQSCRGWGFGENFPCPLDTKPEMPFPCLGLFKVTQLWNTSLSHCLLSTTKSTWSQQIRTISTAILKSCSRQIRVLSKLNRNDVYTNCVKAVLVFPLHRGKTVSKRVQDSMPHPSSGNKAVAEPKFDALLGTSIQYFICNNHFSYLSCNPLKRHWHGRAFSPLPSC